LDELLHGVQARLAEIVQTRDRMRGLLDAVLAVASGLELETTLRRIVHAAVDLVDARYGALGVVRPAGGPVGSSTSASTRRPGPGWGIRRRGKGCSES